MTNGYESAPVSPVESLAVIEAGKVPAVEGVPTTVPVAESIDKPGGSSVPLHVNGGVPPEA